MTRGRRLRCAGSAGRGPLQGAGQSRGTRERKVRGCFDLQTERRRRGGPPRGEPAILRKESVSGPMASAAFSGKGAMREAWKQGRGTFSFSASTTPWLNKLMGLPFLLEYPHGCFEQKSSRLLGYTFLGGLLEYLPDPQARRAAYQHVIGETLREFEAGLLADGRLPYWPRGTLPNDFVTIQGAWCVNQAEEAGFDVPERLASELSSALEKMVEGRTAVSRRRCGLLRSSCSRPRARRFRRRSHPRRTSFSFNESFG